MRHHRPPLQIGTRVWLIEEGGKHAARIVGVDALRYRVQLEQAPSLTLTCYRDELEVMDERENHAVVRADAAP